MQPQRDNFVKVNMPMSGNLACQNTAATDSACGSTFSNSAPTRLNVTEPEVVLSVNESRDAPSLAHMPLMLKATFPKEPVTPHVEGLARQWLRNNFAQSSVEEHIFVLTVETLGFETASELAAKLQWRCERPLEELSRLLK